MPDPVQNPSVPTPPPSLTQQSTAPVSDGTPRSLLEIQGPVTYKGSAPVLEVFWESDSILYNF